MNNSNGKINFGGTTGASLEHCVASHRSSKTFTFYSHDFLLLSEKCNSLLCAKEAECTATKTKHTHKWRNEIWFTGIYKFFSTNVMQLTSNIVMPTNNQLKIAFLGLIIVGALLRFFNRNAAAATISSIF